MTTEQIKERVEKICKVADDDEVAHSKEDDLYYDFVNFVAREAPEPFREMARELRRVRKINFARWRA